jgi:membrane associated rhomboid family serine protease
MLDDRSYMRTDSRPRVSVTTILLISLVVSFVFQVAVGPHIRNFDDNFLLSLRGLREGKIWQLLTFQFMHSGPMHLLGNCLGIYFFGRPMEDLLGTKGYLKLYFISGFVGGGFQLALDGLLHGYAGGGVMGASAGVFGLIAAFAARAPDMPITMLVFFFLPVTFPAKVLLMIEGLIAFLGILVPNFMPGIAHAAHLGGMLTGIFFIKWINRPQRAVVVWKPERRKPQLVSNAPKRANWRKPRAKKEELPPGEFISREVDPILEKISAHGIHSLTDQERKILEAARDKMAKR